MYATKAKALYQYACIHKTINSIVYVSGDEAFCELRKLSCAKDANIEKSIKQTIE